MYNCIDCDDLRWNKILDKLPIEKQDIYFSREYYKMHQKNGDGNAKLFYFIDNEDDIAIYPFFNK